MNQTLESTVAKSRHMATAFGICTSVFDIQLHDFVEGAGCEFCQGCQLAAEGECVPLTTHLYGCFEADRWNGQYIYFCPLGLSFASTTVYGENQPMYGMITGPVVMGSGADVLNGNGGLMEQAIGELPSFAPEQITAVAQTQWAVSMFLSCRNCDKAEETAKAQFQVMNTLYDVTNKLRSGFDVRYLIKIEQKLQKMIVQGDKQGAQELINELLGHLYFQSEGGILG